MSEFADDVMPTAPANNAAVEWASRINSRKEKQQDIVTRQTALILEKDRLNKEKDQELMRLRAVVVNAHKEMIKVIPSYNETRLPFEMEKLRLLKTGELLNNTTERLIIALFGHCKIYQANTDASRQAFAMVEGDVNYDDDLDVLERFERESTQKKNDPGALLVPQNLASSRPITPDQGLGDLAGNLRNLALPPSPPESTYSEKKGGSEKTSKSKTTTLQKLGEKAGQLGASLSGEQKGAPASPTVKSPSAKTSSQSKKSSQSRDDNNSKGRGDQI